MARLVVDVEKMMVMKASKQGLALRWEKKKSVGGNESCLEDEAPQVERERMG